MAVLVACSRIGQPRRAATSRNCSLFSYAIKKFEERRDALQSLYVLQTTNSPPGRRPRVEIDQNTDLSLLSNTPQN